MRKFILITASALFLILLVSCKANSLNTADLNAKVNSNEKLLETETKYPEPNEDINSDSTKEPVTGKETVYKNYNYGFILTFPERWENKFYVEQGNEHITIYHENNLLGFGKTPFFTISAFKPKERWEAEGKALAAMTGVQKIYEDDKQVIGLIYPKDLKNQYYDPKLVAEYEEMKKDLSMITESFTKIHYSAARGNNSIERGFQEQYCRKYISTAKDDFIGKEMNFLTELFGVPTYNIEYSIENSKGIKIDKGSSAEKRTFVYYLKGDDPSAICFFIEDNKIIDYFIDDFNGFDDWKAFSLYDPGSCGPVRYD